jgi:hypothetical protein
MHTWDHRSRSGELIGFEISNALIDRRGVLHALERVPGVTITKAPKAWGWHDDDFIHFTLNGHRFEVIEMFGDDRRYWFAPVELGYASDVEAVRKAFAEMHFGGYTF